MSKAAATALRENPSWSRMPPHWLKYALWAYRYSEEMPTRDDVAQALVSAAHKPTRREYK